MSSISTQTKRWHHVGFIILFGLLFSGLMLFVLWSSASARLYGGGAGNCGNFADAIQLAQDGDTIVQMAPGNSSGSPVIFKNLLLSGGWLPTQDCEVNNQSFTETSDYLAYGFQYGAPNTRSELFSGFDAILTLDDPNDSGFPNLDKLVIEHFDLNGGFNGFRGIQGDISGNAEVLLDNVWLQNNNEVSGNGGGISMTVRGGSHLIIEDGAFFTNAADNFGGGLSVELSGGSVLTIENTLIDDNDALFGGGMHLIVNDTSRVYIKNSQFTDNTTFSSNGYGGGAQIVMHGGQVVLDGVTFAGNFGGTDAGGRGGGLFIQMDAGEVVIKNSVFANNSAGNGDGGGLFVESVGSQPANVQIVNTLFENNLPNSYQFLQTGSGELIKHILDQSVFLPMIQKPATPPLGTARINEITLDENFNFVVDFDTFDFTPALPGVHLHFFFDTVSPENAGMPAPHTNWVVYGGSSPFTGYNFAERPFGPYGAEKLCVLVANPDHTVRQGTGNCVKIP